MYLLQVHPVHTGKFLMPTYMFVGCIRVYMFTVLHVHVGITGYMCKRFLKKVCTVRNRMNYYCHLS